MAFVGMEYCVAAKVVDEAEGVMPTYGPKFRVGLGINLDVNLERRDEELEADNGIAEYDNGLLGATLALGVDDIADDVSTELLSEQKATGNTDDVLETDAPAPAVGFGYVRTRKKKGVLSYVAYWYPKTMWAKTSESVQTRGRNSGFQTPTINGKAFPVYLAAEKVSFPRMRHTFNDLAAAKAWVDAKTGTAHT